MQLLFLSIFLTKKGRHERHRELCVNEVNTSTDIGLQLKLRHTHTHGHRADKPIDFCGNTVLSPHTVLVYLCDLPSLTHLLSSFLLPYMCKCDTWHLSPPPHLSAPLFLPALITISTSLYPTAHTFLPYSLPSMLISAPPPPLSPPCTIFLFSLKHIVVKMRETVIGDTGGWALVLPVLHTLKKKPHITQQQLHTQIKKNK